MTVASERARAKGSLLYFAGEILGYSTPRSADRPYLFLDPSPGSPHRGLCDFIQSADIDGVVETLDLEPRGFLKSTIGTIGYALWQLARDPEQAILIIASTRDKALSFLSEIKEHCEGNERMIALFPELTPHHRGPWQDDRIRIEGRTQPRKEPSIRVMGIDQGRAGGHYERIVADDLHDEENSGTAERCQKTIHAYQTFRPLLVDQRKGEIRVTGTRWHGGDLYGWLMERNQIAREKGKEPPVRVRVTKLRGEDGKPLWPAMYDEKQIEYLRASLDPEIYFSQYENDPFTESQQIFKGSDIDRAMVMKDEIPEDAPVNHFTFVDPAFATNSWNDYTAIVTISVHAAPGALHGYLVTVVDVYREKVELSGWLDEIYRVWETWKPSVISVEATSTAKVIDHALREEMRRRGTLPIRPIDRGGGHATVKGKQRIRKIEPYLRNGTLRLVKGARGIDAMIKELRDYPRGSHDDAIDALADFPEIVFRPDASSTRKRRDGDLSPTTWDEYLQMEPSFAEGGIADFESYDGVRPGIVVKG